MRALACLGLLLLSTGCSFTIEQLVPSGGGYSTFTPAYGRAYFLKKGWFGSRVTVCDVQQANSTVICYDTGAPVAQ